MTELDSMILSEPLRFKVNDGIATDIKGGRSSKSQTPFCRSEAQFNASTDQSSVWTISQFGFGLNPKSKLIGNAS